MKKFFNLVVILCLLFFTLTSCQMRRSKMKEISSERELDNGNVENAIMYINDAIKITPNRSILFFKKALYLNRLNLYDEALNSINMSINLCDTIYTYYSAKANILVEMNQIDSAFFYYSEAIKMEPSKSSIYVGRGLLYEKINNSEKAFLDFNKAISLDSTHYNAFYKRGLLYGTAKKDYDSAIKDFSIVINNITSNTSLEKQYLGAAYLLRGTCYNLSGDLDKACSDFKKAKELGLKEADKHVKENCT